MRVTISQKLFWALISVLAITIVIAIGLFYGIHSLRIINGKIGVLQEIKLNIRTIESFHGVSNGKPTEREKVELDEAFANLSSHLSEVNNFQSELPEHIRANILDLEEQLEYYKKANSELLARKRLDSSIHADFYCNIEEIAKILYESHGSIEPKANEIISKMITAGGAVIHERDISSIKNLRAELKKSDKVLRNRNLGATLEGMVENAEKSYLNYLSTIEQENYTNGTGVRFIETANLAITALEKGERQRQDLLINIIFSTILVLSLGLLAWWQIAKRYTDRFTKSSKAMIDPLRRGSYEIAPPEFYDDEFGDLLKFINEMAKSLKKTHDLLIASELKYKSMVENIADWVWECDADYTLLYSSPICRKLFGIEPEEAIGRPICAFLAQFSSDEQLHICRESLANLEKSKTLHSAFTQDGKDEIYLESIIECRRDEDGTLLGFRGVTRDVTQRALAEAEQHRLREQLLQSQKMEAVGTLAGGVAHDFNNLLQAIGGYADLLLNRRNLSQQDYTAVQRILEATSHAASLTNQLLFFSKRTGTNHSATDLNALINHSVDLLERTIPKMIRVKTELFSPLPKIQADPLQLEHVLINLAVNARDAMPQGGEITIKTFSGENGKSAGIAFSDTGSGIAKENLERIFEPFFTTKETGKGTGLGLAMVYGIVKSHNGTITVNSQLGEGTTFIMEFPAASDEAQEKVRPLKENYPDASNGIGRVLFVDDEEQIREICKEALVRAGYTVIMASSGEEALSIYENGENPVDIVILDMNMPGMGGSNCCKAIKKLNPEAKIIIATGYSEYESSFSPRTDPRIGFLRKPYRMHTLLEVIKELLNKP